MGEERKVDDMIRKLEEAYSQGRISRETYESMKRKYEEERGKSSTAGTSGVSTPTSARSAGTGGRAKLGMAVAAAGLVLIVVGAAGMAGLIPGLGGQQPQQPQQPAAPGGGQPGGQQPPPPPPPGGQQPPGEQQPPGGEGGQGGQPSLTSLLTGGGEWWVTYDFTGTFEGRSASGTVQIAVKGGKFLYKMDTTYQGQPTQFLVINTPEETVQCTRIPAQGWVCYRVSQPQVSYVNPAEEAETESRSETPVYVGTRTYAGELSHCFRWESTGSEVCVTEDGIPTYFKGYSEGGTVEMEATSVSRSVPDSLFRPPAPPAEMPGVGG